MLAYFIARGFIIAFWTLLRTGLLMRFKHYHPLLPSRPGPAPGCQGVSLLNSAPPAPRPRATRALWWGENAVFYTVVLDDF